MYRYPKAIEKLIAAFSRIPGIGRKTAQRIAFHILSMPQEEVNQLADAIRQVKRKIKTCSICHNVSEQDPCAICSDARRDRSRICVVEKPWDISAIEGAGVYNGLYHVLGGVLSAEEGADPTRLNIESLEKRIKEGEVREVILALNPTHEGEITSHFLVRVLSKYPVTITRIGLGLPVGATLEYTDFVTIAEAMKSRFRIKIK